MFCSWKVAVVVESTIITRRSPPVRVMDMYTMGAGSFQATVLHCLTVRFVLFTQRGRGKESEKDEGRE